MIAMSERSLMIEMPHRLPRVLPWPGPTMSPRGSHAISRYLVYHFYDAFDQGDAWIQVRPLAWVGGWPVTGQALVPVPGQSGPPAS
jgi:hypothetical protein